MVTTKFKEYAHYKFVLRHSTKRWGYPREISGFHIWLCLANHWLHDLNRILRGRKFKRDYVGNIIK